MTILLLLADKIISYYRHLAPLTPVSPPDFRNLQDNPTLLNEEPMLVITLLLIASRYMRLTGPGGQTRSHTIHERLWVCLQSLVTRMFWGQEHYGLGRSAATSKKRNARTPEKGGLRTLGTIERYFIKPS